VYPVVKKLPTYPKILKICESTFSTEHDMNESTIITSVRFNKKPWTEDEDNKLLRFLDGNGSKWKWYPTFN
jgi:hypothetical protein